MKAREMVLARLNSAKKFHPCLLKIGKALLLVLFLLSLANPIQAADPGQANKSCSTEGVQNKDPSESVGVCTPPKKCDTEDCIDTAPADGINRVSGTVGNRNQNYVNGVAVGSTGHKGTDYAAGKGSAIYAAADGVVEIVKYNYKVDSGGREIGYGNYIAIRHPDGKLSIYAHMNCWASGIKVGQKVSKGDVIGFVGNTGGSTGAHLHYEIRDKNGNALNPLASDATSLGFCTPPEKFANKGTGNNAGSGGGAGGGAGGAGGGSAGGTQENTHTDKDCDPSIFKLNYEKCLFCNLFKVAFNTCSALAKRSFETFADPVATLVAVGFALWIAFKLLTFLSSLKTEEPKRFFKELFEQAFVVIFVYFFLKSDSATFMSIALEPIFNTGFKLARLAMSGDFACGDTSAYGIIADGGLPPSMGESILCTTKAIQDKLTNLMAMGTSSMCVGIYVKNFYYIFPHLGYILAGLGMWVGALFLLFVFPFLMLDSVLHMGISCALLPLAIGAYAFDLTKKYVNKVWETFLHAMFQFIFLTIVIIIICTALEQIMDGAVSDSEVQGGLWTIAVQRMRWTGVPFLQVIFILLLAWAVLGQIASFAKSFASSISSGSEGRKIGGMAASFAKNAYQKTVAPALKTVGGDMASGVASAGGAVKSFAVDRMNNARAKNYMDADYRQKHGITEGTDENGNTTYTRNTKSWLRRRDKERKLTMVNGEPVWTQSKKLSDSTEQKTSVSRDIKHETIEHNGQVVSDYSEFNDSKYQHLLKGTTIDTAAIEELRNNNANAIDAVNTTILYQTFETRMPGIVKGHMELRHMADNGKISVRKDENGNEIMEMTKVEQNGTVHTYQMITDAEGKVQTIYTKLQKNGKEEILRSNGVVNKQTTRVREKDGSIKWRSEKDVYAVAKRFTNNRSALPVDAFGHLAGYMPSKEELGLSEEEWRAFCRQYLNERGLRSIPGFAD